jgi:hypothetical protein
MTHPSIVTAPTGIEPRYISALAQAALKDRVNRGLGPDQVPVSAVDIEPDGRKVNRAMRALVDAGLVRETSASPTKYQAQIEPVLALLTAAKPNLSTMVNDWHRNAIVEERQPIGVPFAQLALGEQLWVVTYPHEYKFTWVGHHKEIAFKLGDALPDKHWNMSLIVSDEALRNEFEAVIRTRKVDALMKQNASWALEKMLKLDEETIKTFASIGEWTFRHGGYDGFSGDPATWAETAQRLVERAHARLASAMKQVEAAAKVTQVVAQHGGWDKLGADLRVKVEAHLDGTDTDEDESTDKEDASC